MPTHVCIQNCTRKGESCARRRGEVITLLPGENDTYFRPIPREKLRDADIQKLEEFEKAKRSKTEQPNEHQEEGLRADLQKMNKDELEGWVNKSFGGRRKIDRRVSQEKLIDQVLDWVEMEEAV